MLVSVCHVGSTVVTEKEGSVFELAGELGLLMCQVSFFCVFWLFPILQGNAVVLIGGFKITC